jgi:hypothetical protein
MKSSNIAVAVGVVASVAGAVSVGLGLAALGEARREAASVRAEMALLRDAPPPSSLETLTVERLVIGDTVIQEDDRDGIKISGQGGDIWIAGPMAMISKNESPYFTHYGFNGLSTWRGATSTAGLYSDDAAGIELYLATPRQDDRSKLTLMSKPGMTGLEVVSASGHGELAMGSFDDSGGMLSLARNDVRGITLGPLEDDQDWYGLSVGVPDGQRIMMIAGGDAEGGAMLEMQHTQGTTSAVMTADAGGMGIVATVDPAGRYRPMVVGPTPPPDDD